MEIQVTLAKWNPLMEDLKREADFIKRKEMELQGLRRDLRKVINGNEKERIIRVIYREEEHLHRQAEILADLRIALEKAKRMYEHCEQDLMDACEIPQKRFQEKIHVTNLNGWGGIPVRLQGREERNYE